MEKKLEEYIKKLKSNAEALDSSVMTTYDMIRRNEIILTILELEHILKFNK